MRNSGTTPSVKIGESKLHAVTKILVVFAVILSILLSALTVSYSANAERIKGQYSAIEAQKNAFQTQLQIAQSKHSEDRLHLQNEIDAVNQQLNSSLAEKASLQQASTRLTADVEQAKVELQGVQARIDQLAATGQTQTLLISSYRSELSTLREDELKAKQREIELADHNNDLSGQLEVAIQTTRALQERLAELQQAQQGATSVASGANRGVAQPIRARITSVSTAPNGDLLAQIDAGANDRLTENMELTIVQDEHFAGVLKLNKVELNEAVGLISLNQGKSIQPGAFVTTIH